MQSSQSTETPVEWLEGRWLSGHPVPVSPDRVYGPIFELKDDHGERCGMCKGNFWGPRYWRAFSQLGETGHMRRHP